MPEALALAGGAARVIVTERADGDARPWLGDGALRAVPGTFEERLGSWTFVHQVHGDAVVVVDESCGPLEVEADALVSAAIGARLAVIGADCALVGLASSEGVIGAVHAGWRGLAAGVLERAVEAMRDLGATDVEAALGPCIHAECYEFGRDELAVVAGVLGDEVRGETREGRPALDLPGGVRRSLARVGVSVVASLGGCTACDDRWYSHRARRDTERHALAIWRTDARAGERPAGEVRA